MKKLIVKYGPMSSNKTNDLITNDYKYRVEYKQNSLVLKPKVDTKGEEFVKSRIGLKRKVDFLIDDEMNLFEKIKKIDEKIDIIFVDESQFLTINQAKDLYKIAVELDIPVMCYGLKVDFLNRPFPTMSYLLTMAHSLYEMKTVCKCGRKATCNLRLVDGKPVFSGDDIVIDDDKKVSYKALCAKCYYDEKKRV